MFDAVFGPIELEKMNHAPIDTQSLKIQGKYVLCNKNLHSQKEMCEHNMKM